MRHQIFMRAPAAINTCRVASLKIDASFRAAADGAKGRRGWGVGGVMTSLPTADRWIGGAAAVCI